MNEREIFEAALDIIDIDAGRLDEFLANSCGSDHVLREGVESLLAAHASGSDFLNTPLIQEPSKGMFSGMGPETTHGNAEDDSLSEKTEAIDLSFLGPSTQSGSIGTLGHYEMLNVVGRGGCGIVMKAFDEKLHRIVAIKVMNTQLAVSSTARNRLVREARAAAAIRHENLIPVYSVEEQPIPYLVMEFIDGQTLEQKLRADGALNVDELLHIGGQIARGLAAAHKKGLIHRDIKPGNILLESGPEQEVKITDFGLARAVEDVSLTQSGVIQGTPLYMSPEQAQGEPVDHRSDLFSLGSVLYELATGRAPFLASSTLAVLNRVVNSDPRPIQEIAPDIPAWLIQIINKLLEKKPDDRIQTASEVATLLTECQSQLQAGVTITAVSQLEILPSSSAAKPAASSAVAPTSPWNRRMLLIAASLFGAAALVTAVVVSLPPKKIEDVARIQDAKKGPQQSANTAEITMVSDVIAADADRELAKWVLSLPDPRSIFIVETAKELSVAVTEESQLPSGRFHVESVLINDQRNIELITDEDLERIGQAHQLRHLEISASSGGLTGITDRGIELLSRSPAASSLISLSFESLSNITDASISSFNGFRGLAILKLEDCRVTDAGLSRLDLPELANVVFELTTSVTMKGVEDLLHRSPRIASISFRKNRLDDADFTPLIKSSLVRLDVPETGITNQRLAEIGKIETLISLDLAINPAIDDAGMKYLENLSKLRSLRLEGTRITDAGVESLTKLRALNYFNLSDCENLTDKSLESLANLRGLTDLRIPTNPQLTEPAVRKLQAALPKCRITSDYPAAAAVP